MLLQVNNPYIEECYRAIICTYYLQYKITSTMSYLLKIDLVFYYHVR